MIAFPNCKINLGLNVINKREDGYHNLETVFYPIPFSDVLEIISAEENIRKHSSEKFRTSGLMVDTDENNLCSKAYKLLKKNFPGLSAIKMHLHKTIPLGAGLGGGSSDAAFTLMLLNQKFQLNLTVEHLMEYALQLGSDCPFFLINKPCFATGRGEFLQPFNLDLSKYKILIVTPDVHISTKYAFEKIIPRQPKKLIVEIIKQPPETWKDQLVNDFEEPVFAIYPRLKAIKEELYKTGAVYASLSGSGSTVFALFYKEHSPVYTTPYFHKWIDLKS